MNILRGLCRCSHILLHRYEWAEWTGQVWWVQCGSAPRGQAVRSLTSPRYRTRLHHLGGGSAQDRPQEEARPLTQQPLSKNFKTPYLKASENTLHQPQTQLVKYLPKTSRHPTSKPQTTLCINLKPN